MTTDRPYKPTRTIPSAIQEVVACSGTQFNPKVAKVLVRLHEQGLLPQLESHIPADEAAA